MANPVEALVANASTKIDATRHPVDVSRHPVDESVYAAYLVQKALGEQALSTALELDLSGHWQQLNALGDSLHALHSLTELDLSRNGLTSLEGLASLRNLRHLNVYYNVVGRLFEVDRLRANPQLESLDLRLNPVTHAGRRHRMRALLAAPSLQVLDGRDVTGAERARVEMARVERADDAEDIDGLPRHDEEEDALADGPSDDDADIDGFESDGLLRPVDEALAVGPSMAAAVEAAEERWAAEKVKLAHEIDELKAQGQRDAEAIRQSAELVRMLQQTHEALINSNEHLLQQVGELKAQHELEVHACKLNFDELAAELARTRALAATAPGAVSTAPGGVIAASGGGGSAAGKPHLAAYGYGQPRATADAGAKKAAVLKRPPAIIKGKENGSRVE